MRISFFGHFGSLNTGNESTLSVALSRFRTRFPDGEFSCICTNPHSVEVKDGIEAVPITARDAKIWNRDASVPRRLKMAVVGLRAELRECAHAFASLRGTDFLVIPGTGLLTDAYGIAAWGPYNLFKWTLMARLRGARVAFVSVGAGPIDTSLGRILVKWALSLAEYRSYRDRESLSYLQTIGFPASKDHIYPDLVFGMPEAELPVAVQESEGDECTRGRRVVGLGLMEDAGRYGRGARDARSHTRYLESLVEFVQWLLAHDYDVKLLLGDEDTAVITDFKVLLRASAGTYDENRVIDTSITSTPQLLAHLSTSDFVVATRFHNLIFAFLLNTPVISISFHHKCTSLMESMGLSDYSHNLTDINSKHLIEQFERMTQDRDDIVEAIKARVEEFRADLNQQYELLFRSTVESSGGGRST